MPSRASACAYHRGVLPRLGVTRAAQRGLSCGRMSVAREGGPCYHSPARMYPFLLFVHSWLRWLVLLAALWALVRALGGFARGRAFEPGDRRAHTGLIRLADLQVTLGLLLYLWLSPIVRSAFADMGVAMRSAPLRFFAIEHITAMLLAISVLYVAAARGRRASSDRQRHRVALAGTLGFSLLVLVGIPWPMLKHGRPLARTQLSEGAPIAGGAPELYRKRCAACHGESGRGDGLAATAMQPRPRDFADAAWQRSTPDAALHQVIAQGGLARQLSASMPPHPDLREEQLAELVRFIRGLGRAAPAR